MDKQILKKKYAQPALKVVELRQRAQLLVGSETTTSGSPTYKKFNDEETW